MLQLYDVNKIKVQGLTEYKDYKIESVLDSGDKTLSFSYPSILSNSILEECYIRNETDEFVIKEIKDNGRWKSIVAVMNVEELEGQAWEHFDFTNIGVKECLTLVLAGTSWKIEMVDNISKKRTIKKTNCSSWDLIQEVKKSYRVEIEFDTLNKTIKVYEKRGSNRGSYFIDTLNLKELELETDSYDYYTKIIAIGKGDIKVEVENYQYSNKVKTLIWKDEKYTDVDSLREDAILKLNEISKPRKSYKASVIDLARLSDKYRNILDYKLGDVVTLISKDLKIKDKQRIVKITEYPDDPSKNDCEMSNITLTFKDLQKEFKDTSSTVSNITEDNGKISEKAIKEAVDKITIDKADIESLNAAEAKIGVLEATTAKITELTTIRASIDNLNAGKANITDLTANNIKFDVASGNTLDLQTLLSKFVTGENGQFLNITSSNVVIANAVIKDAMIENVSVNKLKAGSIDTNKITLSSSDGGLSIVGPTMQFKDSSKRVRLQLGQDTSGNFNFILRGTDGTTTLIDHTGIKEKAIADKLIKSNMVADNAIGEKQINYSSLVTGLNKDTNTSLIQASKVEIDLTGQSLDIAFNRLKSNVDSKETRNLFIEKDAIDGYYSDTDYILGSTYRTSDYIEVNPGEIYTLCKFSVDGYHRIITFDKDKNRVGTRLINKEIILKYIIPANIKYIRISIEKDNKYKVEKGDNSSPVYSQAPEDVEEKIESNTTAITVAQGQIEGLIKDTSITKGDITTLKDKYTSIKATVDGINTTVASHASSIGAINTNIGGLNGKVTTVENKQASLEQNLSGFETTVANTYSTKTELSKVDGKVTGLTSRVSTAESSITQLNNKIDLKVEATEVNTIVNSAIDKVQVGGRNLQKNSSFKENLSHWAVGIGYSRDISKQLDGVNSVKFERFSLSSNSTSYLYSGNNKIKTVEGDILTVSASFYTDNVSSIDGSGVVIGIWHYDLNGQHISNSRKIIDFENGKWVSVSHTATVPQNTEYSAIVIATYRNGVYWIAKPMFEKGNKATDWTPAIEDVDSAISMVDTKIETTNNKVASIETNLSSITSRVSSTESNIKTVNGNISSLQSRMSSAEQKITSSAIISTVQSTINNAMNSAINNTNSATDSKLQNYATKSSLTQTSDRILASFESNGGYNLLKNGALKNGSSYWEKKEYNLSGSNLTRDFSVRNDSWTNREPALQLQINNMNSGEFGFSQAFTTIIGKRYVFTCYLAGHRSNKIVVIRGTTESESKWLANKTFGAINGGEKISDWVKVVIPFVAQRTRTSVDINITSTIGNDGYVWAKEMMVSEGDSWKPFSPHPDEVYSGNTVIDATGVTIYNGALTVKNSKGEIMLQGDSSGNLSFSGKLQPHDYQLRLFGNDCKIDGSAGAIRMQLNPQTYVSVGDPYIRTFNKYSANGTNYGSMGVNSEGHFTIFGQRSMIKLLGNSSNTAIVQARWTSETGYAAFAGSDFLNRSTIKDKTNVESVEEVNFSKILLENNIFKYNLKADVENALSSFEVDNEYNLDESIASSADVKLGFILEELTEEAKVLLNPYEEDAISIYSMCSILWRVCQEQEKKIEFLERMSHKES